MSDPPGERSSSQLLPSGVLLKLNEINLKDNRESSQEPREKVSHQQRSSFGFYWQQKGSKSTDETCHSKGSERLND